MRTYCLYLTSLTLIHILSKKVLGKIKDVQMLLNMGSMSKNLFQLKCATRRMLAWEIVSHTQHVVT